VGFPTPFWLLLVERENSGLVDEKTDSMGGVRPLDQQEFADPDWDAAVDEAQDEQQWQVSCLHCIRTYVCVMCMMDG
jgi:hypothetical protein